MKECVILYIEILNNCIYMDKNIVIGKTNKISKTAIIHNDVIIGDNNFIGDNVIIYPNTTIGNNNNIFTGNIIGEFAISSNDGWRDYDLYKCKGVTIEDNNVFHVNNIVYSGIENKTYVGNHNKILGECSINHDTQIHNNVVVYPRVITAGYTELLNNSNVGMSAVIHQRIIVGQYSMIGANNMVTKNVFPYYINISNKIHRLNKTKLLDYMLEYDTILREIQHNFENKKYDLIDYTLPPDIVNVLDLFISKIKH